MHNSKLSLSKKQKHLEHSQLLKIAETIELRSLQYSKFQELEELNEKLRKIHLEQSIIDNIYKQKMKEIKDEAIILNDIQQQQDKIDDDLQHHLQSLIIDPLDIKISS